MGGVGAEVYFIHPDHQGTPLAMTDKTGAVVWRANYEPFGQATITTQTKTLNLRFPGQYFDAETGLHYNYYRDYDPTIGRYVQSDPIGLQGGLNPYIYAYDNPLRFVDEKGLCGWPCFIVPVVGACFSLYCIDRATDICEVKYPETQLLSADPDGMKKLKCLSDQTKVCVLLGGPLSDPIGGGASTAGEAVGHEMSCEDHGCE